MLQAGDFVRIQEIPKDTDINIDWSSYEKYVGVILNIEDGYAFLDVPEKMYIFHKPPCSGAPLIQLKRISEEEFTQQIKEAKKVGREYWDKQM